MAAAYCFRRCPRLAKALLFSWVLLAATAIPAQRVGLGHTPLNTESTTYSLRGTIVNSVTGDPIRRALVVAGTHMQLTDAQGRFEFGGLLPGQYGLGVQKPGFFNQAEISAGDSSGMVEVGPKNTDVVIKLVPEGVIFGHLTDQDGDPLEGVFMHVRGWRIMNGRRQLQDAGGQSTDEDGAFRLFGLMPGTYYLASGAVPDRGPIQMRLRGTRGSYPSSYFPGVRQLSAATPIQLAAGQKMQADFSLHAFPAFQVTGQVTAYPGAHVNGVQILDASDPTSSLPVDVDPGTGTFMARVVPAGSYTILVMAVDDEGRTLVGQKAITVSTNVYGLAVPVAPSVSISVLVQTEFTNSSLAGNREPIAVRLSPVGDYGQNYFSSDQGRAAQRDRAGGGLVIASVQPGRYYAEIISHGTWYAESAVSGSTDLFREPLTVSPGSQVAPIQVLVRDDGASLAGMVRSEGSPVSASVLVVMEDAPLRMPQLLMSNRQGAFQTDNLPPGDYMVLAFDNMAGLEYANRDALRDYLSQGTRVTLGPKDAKSVNVEVIHR